MKVYVVKSHWHSTIDDSESNVEGAYSTKEKAKEIALALAKDKEDKYYEEFDDTQIESKYDLFDTDKPFIQLKVNIYEEEYEFYETEVIEVELDK